MSPIDIPRTNPEKPPSLFFAVCAFAVLFVFGVCQIHAQSIAPSVGNVGNLTSTFGAPSAAQAFTITGTALPDLTYISAPAGFEISKDNVAFSPGIAVDVRGASIQGVDRGLSATGPLVNTTNGQESPNYSAFAALKADGSVVGWGSAANGGDLSSAAGQLTSNVTRIYSSGSAFAALKTDGSVVAWGNSSSGGDSSAVGGSLASNVVKIHSTLKAFAALKADGSVVTWGNSNFGGDSSAVAESLSSNVTAIFSTVSAFAALKGNGSVVTWGDATSGADSSAVAENLTSNVKMIYSNQSGFAALKDNGSVVTWGDETFGGNSSNVAGSLASGVKSICSTQMGFAALKADGSVVYWGNVVAASSAAASSLTSNVTAIYSNGSSFAALKDNGSVVTWGSSVLGGDSSAVAGNLNSDVTDIFSTRWSFAALKGDGSVVTWGHAAYGGNSSAVAQSLSSNVERVHANSRAFAALKKDGSVVTWGAADYGGDSGAVSDKLTSNVISMYSLYGLSSGCFVAVKADGSLVRWGNSTADDIPPPANIGQVVSAPAAIYVRVAANAPSGQILGNITVASHNAPTRTVSISGLVNKAQPVVTALPVASALALGQGLSNSTLAGGAANVPGSFAFATPAAVPPAGNSTQAVVFTPADSGNYTTATVNVTVSTTAGATAPAYIFYAADPSDVETTQGDSVELVPNSGELMFLRNDGFTGITFAEFIAGRLAGNDRIYTLNHNPVADRQTEYLLNFPQGIDGATRISAFIAHPASQGLITEVRDLLQPAGFQVYGIATSAISTVEPVGACTLNGVLYRVYYLSKKGFTTGYQVKLKVEAFVENYRYTPVVTTLPTASAITAGQSLSQSTLSGGNATVPGSFAFADPSSVPTATGLQTIVFTPADATNYATVNASATVTVNAAATSPFNLWTGGNATPTPASILRYAVGGGGYNPGAPAAEQPTLQMAGGNLSITAVVRTNDPSLAIHAEATTDLASGNWTSTGTSATTAGIDQTGLAQGLERRRYSVPLSGSQKFLRLRAIYTGQN